MSRRSVIFFIDLIRYFFVQSNPVRKVRLNVYLAMEHFTQLRTSWATGLNHSEILWQMSVLMNRDLNRKCEQIA